jgi:hypothetical protein
MNLRKTASSLFLVGASLLVAVPLVQIADVAPAHAESQLVRDLEQEVQKLGAAAKTIDTLAGQPSPNILELTKWNTQSQFLHSLHTKLAKWRADFHALVVKVKDKSAGETEAKALREKLAVFLTNTRNQFAAHPEAGNEAKARQASAIAALDGL